MTSITLDQLPNDLLLEEIISAISLKDALAFCSSSRSSRRLCGDQNYWVRRLSSLSYRQLQENVIYWSYSGLLKDTFYAVFPALLPLLDLRTVAYVYLYALEQKLEKEANSVKIASVAFFGRSYTRVDSRFFGGSLKSYRAIQDLLDAIIDLEDTKTLDRLFFAAFHSFDDIGEPHANPFITEYISDLLVHALSVDQILSLYRRGSTFMVSNLSIALLPAIVRNAKGLYLVNDKRTDHILQSQMVKPTDLKQLYFERYGKDLRANAPFRTRESVIDIIERFDINSVPISFIASLLEPEELLSLYPNENGTTSAYYALLLVQLVSLGYTKWAERLKLLLDQQNKK